MRKAKGLRSRGQQTRRGRDYGSEHCARRWKTMRGSEGHMAHGMQTAEDPDIRQMVADSLGVPLD